MTVTRCKQERPTSELEPFRRGSFLAYELGEVLLPSSHEPEEK